MELRANGYIAGLYGLQVHSPLIMKSCVRMAPFCAGRMLLRNRYVYLTRAASTRSWSEIFLAQGREISLYICIERTFTFRCY